VNAEFFDEQRREMVTAIRAMAEHMAPQIGKTALDERVLRAMAKVPRHEFVPVELHQYAYLNRPIPIGFDKTISQPLMVAVMTDLLELKPDDVLLEIGTGLGYQSAVLAELAHFASMLDRAIQRSEVKLIEHRQDETKPAPPPIPARGTARQGLMGRIYLESRKIHTGDLGVCGNGPVRRQDQQIDGRKEHRANC
jgi:Protein-L-isoaspartate(D-aspartate) O-methyltransferase (PCMT)